MGEKKKKKSVTTWGFLVPELRILLLLSDKSQSWFSLGLRHWTVASCEWSPNTRFNPRNIPQCRKKTKQKTKKQTYHRVINTTTIGVLPSKSTVRSGLLCKVQKTMAFRFLPCGEYKCSSIHSLCMYWNWINSINSMESSPMYVRLLPVTKLRKKRR